MSADARSRSTGGVATAPTVLYGLIAEFSSPASLVSAARRAREAGYTRLDGFSPYPIHGMTSALGLRPTRLPVAVLIGGMLGAATALGMMWFSSVVHYPINVGGRPLASWPMFIPITFELTILFAALTAVFGMLGANGLPMPYHPVFNAERFALASRDTFFLCIEARDPKFDLQKTREFLESLEAVHVGEVPE